MGSLRSNLTKSEARIEELSIIKNSKPSVSKLAYERARSPVSPRPSSPSFCATNYTTVDITKPIQTIAQKLENTSGLFQNIIGTLVAQNVDKTSQMLPDGYITKQQQQVEQITAQYDLEIAEIREQYERQIEKYQAEELHGLSRHQLDDQICGMQEQISMFKKTVKDQTRKLN